MLEKEKPQHLLKLWFTNDTNLNELQFSLYKNSVRMCSASVCWIINRFDFRVKQPCSCKTTVFLRTPVACDNSAPAPGCVQNRHMSNKFAAHARSAHVVAQEHCLLCLFISLLQGLLTEEFRFNKTQGSEVKCSRYRPGCCPEGG